MSRGTRMSIHMDTVRVNNFMKAGTTPIDWLSKVFIAAQYPLGLNRITLLCNKTVLNGFSVIYVLWVITGITFLIFDDPNIFTFTYYPQIAKYIQYIICVILCYATRNKICEYYEKLNKFDAEFEYNIIPNKVNRVSVMILLSMGSLGMFPILLAFQHGKSRFIPFHLIQTIENHYYAFLFNLMDQRLLMINNCIESSLLKTIFPTRTSILEHSNTENREVDNIAMNKLMDSYYIIIDAYDLLTDGIKWQLLFITSTSFIFVLFISHHFAIDLLTGRLQFTLASSFHILGLVMLVTVEALPLLAPCMCCDNIRYQVRRLRELLAFKLFESRLDKSNKTVARALLALTKARNLSFSLLRMVDISISLPFSFLGLVATYLIILLQFEKVVNPYKDRSTLSSNFTN